MTDYASLRGDLERAFRSKYRDELKSILNPNRDSFLRDLVMGDQQPPFRRTLSLPEAPALRIEVTDKGFTVNSGDAKCTYVHDSCKLLPISNVQLTIVGDPQVWIDARYTPPSRLQVIRWRDSEQQDLAMCWGGASLDCIMVDPRRIQQVADAAQERLHLDTIYARFIAMRNEARVRKEEALAARTPSVERTLTEYLNKR